MATANLHAPAPLAVAILRTYFCVDYQTTRHVYFTVVALHVLAEISFLLRMP